MRSIKTLKRVFVCFCLIIDLCSYDYFGLLSVPYSPFLRGLGGVNKHPLPKGAGGVGNERRGSGSALKFEIDNGLFRAIGENNSHTNRAKPNRMIIFTVKNLLPILFGFIAACGLHLVEVRIRLIRWSLSLLK